MSFIPKNHVLSSFFGGRFYFKLSIFDLFAKKRLNSFL